MHKAAVPTASATLAPPPAAPREARTAVIVGGGFSGAVLALKLARARPGDRVRLIERRRRAGVGLAYGACAPGHLLNVPVSRMDCGLQPSFETWLQSSGADLADALAESGGRLADAFVPRALFGRYMEARLAAALADPDSGITRVHGEAVRLADGWEGEADRAVVLEDGRRVEGDLVVLATGNMSPGPLTRGTEGGGAVVVQDPWAPDALDDLDPDAPVLLVGAGLTAVDVLLLLESRGHRGPVTAVSRNGLRPHRHAPGGSWAPFLGGPGPLSPVQAVRAVRREAARARAAGVPWQRVFDAARPDVARVWRGWSLAERRRFLRRLRTVWDVHRHRLAPRLADRVETLLASGRLRLVAGRLAGLEPTGAGVRARLALRDGDALELDVARVINCTGPRSDFDREEAPLFGHLRRAGLIQADELRLGLVTRRCAVVGAIGAESDWLFAVGPLTRPSLWEVTAVPEINAQVDAFVAGLGGAAPAAASPLDRLFADLGAGI